MASTPKQRLQQLNQHLQAQQLPALVKDADGSENPPKIRSIAPDSVGQYATYPYEPRERRVMLSKPPGG